MYMFGKIYQNIQIMLQWYVANLFVLFICYFVFCIQKKETKFIILAKQDLIRAKRLFSVFFFLIEFI